MGWQYPPFYGKSKDFYVKQKAKYLAKIEKLNGLVKACDDAIAEIDK